MLPVYKDPNKNLMLMQSNWSAQLNPVLQNPLSTPSTLKNIELINGVNVINHLLGQQMQGWYIIDIDKAATIFRSKPFNSLTLTLTSNAACMVNLAVF